MAVSASAADSDGTIAKVEFYAGATLLAADTTAPYSYVWSSVPAGTYSLTAVAYDNSGARVTSAARSLTVTGTPTPTPAPTAVVFRASADHSQVTSYRLDVFASGANPATATAVVSSDLGKGTPDANGDITVNRSAVFSALAAGSYQATVTATGAGGSSRSAAVAFTR
jgi:chitinase